jgi:hypothetical protein
MTAQLTINNLAAWQATVAAANASRPEGTPEITVEQYAQARLDELGESYQRAAIEQAKRDYDDMVTLAASLPDDKKAQLIAFVQELANE